MRMLVAAGPVVLSAHTLPSRECLGKNNSLRHMTRMMPTLRIGPLDRTQMTVNHQLRCRATGNGLIIRPWNNALSTRVATESGELPLDICQVYTSLIDLRSDGWKVNLAVTSASCKEGRLLQLQPVVVVHSTAHTCNEAENRQWTVKLIRVRFMSWMSMLACSHFVPGRWCFNFSWGKVLCVLCHFMQDWESQPISGLDTQVIGYL